MHFRIDVPARGIAALVGLFDPSHSLKLLKDAGAFISGNLAHGTASTAKGTHGHHVKPVGEDIASHVLQSIMIICKPDNARVEREAMPHDVVRQEVSHTRCSVFCDQNRQCFCVHVFNAVPDDAKAWKQSVELADMGR